MQQTVPDILARIVEVKRRELRERTAEPRLAERAADGMATRRDFRAALEGSTPAVIAEIKKGSPSKGIFTESFDPAALATSYEAGGAAALSVLTDRQFFYGSFADLQAARGAVGLPALRKDFTIDERHIVEAAAYGADAILLIAAILSVNELRRFREVAASLGLAALVEVHDEAELTRAVDSGAEILGVNNRDLHTFRVSLETSVRLAERMPAGVLRVSESGIHSAADVQRLRGAGYQAFLVGEHLMLSPDPAAALRALRA